MVYPNVLKKNRMVSLLFGITLIVSIIAIFFVSSPSSLDNFKSFLSKALSKNSKDTIEIIPSEMEEYGILKEMYKSCANLKAGSQSSGISNGLSLVCEEACGKRNLNYEYNDCDRDLLKCFCSN